MVSSPIFHSDMIDISTLEYENMQFSLRVRLDEVGKLCVSMWYAEREGRMKPVRSSIASVFYKGSEPTPKADTFKVSLAPFDKPLYVSIAGKVACLRMLERGKLVRVSRLRVSKAPSGRYSLVYTAGDRDKTQNVSDAFMADLVAAIRA